MQCIPFDCTPVLVKKGFKHFIFIFENKVNSLMEQDTMLILLIPFLTIIIVQMGILTLQVFLYIIIKLGWYV